MNPSLVLDIHKSDLETDDFAVASLLLKVQLGENVNNEDFLQFVKKGKEMINMLQKVIVRIIPEG